MNLGVAFGCYCPLHQGHLDLIMQAKRENDKALVFVCGYDNDKRNGEVWLDFDKRIQLIETFFSADPLIKVRCINDTVLGLDESFSEHNWEIWMDEACKQIVEEYGTTADKITFYVGEPSYQIQMLNYGIHHNTYNLNIYIKLVDRGRNLISGTEIRNNPQKCWNKIAEPFRPYFSHNILIAGTASEGKTTLVEDIAKYFGLPYSYEKGRDVYKYKANATDEDFNAKDFMYNLYEQRKMNEECISSPMNPGIFISDTDNIVTLMYAKAYADRENFSLTSEEYEVLKGVAKIYAPTTKWNKIFLFKPTIPDIVDDGERYMADSDIEIRRKFFDTLTSLYDEFGYEYEILDGNYWDKFVKVRDYIDGLKER